MSTVTPQGENTRKAVKWISAQLQDNPEQKIWKLIEEAISIYDLNPFESESLMQFYKKINIKNSLKFTILRHHTLILKKYLEQ